mgnify:CR=1 FL=1
MVLFVEVNEEGIRKMRRRRVVDFIRLSQDWTQFPNIIFREFNYLTIYPEFIVISGKSITYMPVPLYLPLEINALQRQYYDYHGWCLMRLNPFRFNVPDNSYSYRPYPLLSEINLNPPKSLSTIVPTQMSSFI